MAELKHRVWIELEYPKDADEGDKRAALANAMLRRLGVTYDVFWFMQKPHRGCYCVNMGPGGAGFMECADNGHWFNLTMLAGEKVETGG